jgi:hypothetical protein
MTRWEVVCLLYGYEAKGDVEQGLYSATSESE